MLLSSNCKTANFSMITKDRVQGFSPCIWAELLVLTRNQGAWRCLQLGFVG